MIHYLEITTLTEITSCFSPPPLVCSQSLSCNCSCVCLVAALSKDFTSPLLFLCRQLPLKSKIEIYRLPPGPPRTSLTQSPLSFLHQVLAARQFFLAFPPPDPIWRSSRKEFSRRKGLKEKEGSVRQTTEAPPVGKNI